MNNSTALSLPVEYALISSKALTRHLIPLYPLSREAIVKFIYQGINDTYLITDKTSKLILRIYRARWKTTGQVQAEIELLLLLKQQGIAVSYPVADKNNTYIQQIHSPEGERYAVAFSYAEGEKVTSLTPDQARLFGGCLANIHLVTHNRQIPDLHRDYTVDNVLKSTLSIIQMVLYNYKETCKKLEAICAQITNKLDQKILNTLKPGICHGDPHYENVFIDPVSEKITFFDFDFCGNGYLLYDIGSFCFYERNNQANIAAFLEGYAAIMPLNEKEQDLVPYFRVLMRLFHLGARSLNADGIKNPLWFPEEIVVKINDIEKELQSIHS